MQFLIVISETYFQVTAAHVMACRMSTSLTISDDYGRLKFLQAQDVLTFLILYFEALNDACI